MRLGGACPPRRVVVCDLDDTLYPERDYVESGLGAVGRWARSQLGLPHLGPAMIDRFRSGVRERLFDAALAARGIEPTAPLIGRMLQVYRQHAPRITLPKDSLGFLRCAPAGTAIALITDGFLDAQRRKIRALDLHARGVRVAICTDRWGREAWKPSTRSFLHMQALFGLDPGAFVYVADNPDKDFHAPRRLGWATVQLRRPGRVHRVPGPDAQYADAECRTMEEVAELLFGSSRRPSSPALRSDERRGNSAIRTFEEGARYITEVREQTNPC